MVTFNKNISSQHEEVMEKTLILATANGGKASLYESLKQAGATTILESLQAQVKMRDGEITQLQVSSVHYCYHSGLWLIRPPLLLRKKWSSKAEGLVSQVHRHERDRYSDKKMWSYKSFLAVLFCSLWNAWEACVTC
jgi:hypothetical protein